MHNYIQLAKKAIDHIKTVIDLPSEGFICGGSIANLIWEYKSGNKAKINDVDIFVFKGKIDKFIEENDTLFRYTDSEKIYKKNDYGGLEYTNKSNNFYKIENVENGGLLNSINFISNKKDYSFILDSFDLNCVKVGYSIEDDEFIITDDFIDFLNTGEIKITNLKTPAHTAIRMVKKSNELNVIFDKDLEFKLILSVLCKPNDCIKTKFQNRYKEMFTEYSKDLKDYFKLHKVYTPLINDFQKKEDLYTIKPSDEIIRKNSLNYDTYGVVNYFNDNIINTLDNVNQILFYVRNIKDNEHLYKIFKKLKYFYISSDYLDITPTMNDIDLIHSITNSSKMTINNLKGFKLSEQVKIIENLINKFGKDKAILLLEKYRFEPNQKIDDDDVLLYSLIIRKEYVMLKNNKDKNIKCAAKLKK